MNYMYDERVCAPPIPRPIPPATIAAVTQHVNIGDTFRIEHVVPAFRVEEMWIVDNRWVNVLCRNLREGSEQRNQFGLSVINDLLMTDDLMFGWVLVTVVNRVDRQLDLFGGYA